ncbi:MAG TPA: response regulator [Anaerolineales bacterium]|nr:response regulator [Anaerolineales bacterium]
MAPIKVLIADDSAELRKSIRAILVFEPDVKVVAVARDGWEAVELARQHRPDVALMDINMPRVDGLTAIRAIAEVSPNTLCMIMSSEGERDMLRKAMAAGVREYLVKPFSAEDFLQAVARMKVAAKQAKTRSEAIETERDQRLLQLTRAYLKNGRMDDEAAKAYAEYAKRPRADPDILARLAEIFCARRDWHTLRLICERMEKLTPPPK